MSRETPRTVDIGEKNKQYSVPHRVDRIEQESECNLSRSYPEVAREKKGLCHGWPQTSGHGSYFWALRMAARLAIIAPTREEEVFPF